MQVTGCIDQLIHALDSEPDSLNRLELLRQERGLTFLNLEGFTEKEFGNRIFQLELEELKAMVLQSQADGATEIRLCGT